MTRKPPAKRTTSPRANVQTGSVSDALFEKDGEASYVPPSRLSSKTGPLHERILAALEHHGPLCLAELVHVLEMPPGTARLKPHLKTLMHTEQVRAALEISRTHHERLVFVLADKAPSGIWDRVPLKGFQRGGNTYQNTQRRTSKAQAIESHEQREQQQQREQQAEREALAKREELALEMMKRAMELIKR